MDCLNGAWGVISLVGNGILALLLVLGIGVLLHYKRLVAKIGFEDRTEKGGFNLNVIYPYIIGGLVIALAALAFMVWG